MLYKKNPKTALAEFLLWNIMPSWHFMDTPKYVWKNRLSINNLASHPNIRGNNIDKLTF